MNKINNVIELLMLIKQKPGIYIGTTSLERLSSFIDGYGYALWREGIQFDMKIYYNFNEWHAQKYNIQDSILWDTYLPNIYDDSARAFDIFWDDLEEYLKENNIEIPEIK